MSVVAALAIVAGLASCQPASIGNASRGHRRPLALGQRAGRHCGVGQQRHIAPERSLVCSAVARRPHHFTGGPSRAFGWAAAQRGVHPANAKYGGRALGGVAAASCRLAVRLGLALARAASDNKSMHTDVQVLPAAARPRLMGAGDFQR